MSVKLMWATPEVDFMIAHIARVSNPENQDNPSILSLLRYMMKEGHVSPFEMAHACVEINTTRDIGRQILRHRSFSFQEFCVAGDTKVTLELPGGVRRGKRSAYTRSIEHLYSLQQRGMKLPSFVRVFDEATKTFITAGIREVFQTGMKPVYRVTLDNGKSVDCTKEHKFLTRLGFASLEDAVGLRMVGATATFQNNVEIACNGTPAYRDPDWLRSAKQQAIENVTGLAGIASQAGVSTHTIRKALKEHALQFTKTEVSSYTPVWNKGLRGYSLPKHSPETIEKMRKKARKGADSNLWRGGADRSERKKIADWCGAHRSEFMRRAGYKCLRCESSANLEMHHIMPVVERPDLAYDKDNIEVLCRHCHMSHHGISGDYKTWRERSKGNTLTTCWSRVVKVKYIGEQMTYDLEVDHESHNYIANGIVTHNSQRYQDVNKLDAAPLRECRMQDTKNRQSSIETTDTHVIEAFEFAQQEVLYCAEKQYRQMIDMGVAKEQARALMPEGLTASRMYMVGSFRSWIHYLQSRLHPSTQKEHRMIAKDVLILLKSTAPLTMNAFFPAEVVE